MSVDPRRVRQLNMVRDRGPGPVLYWMSRDHRVRDNWAFLYAQELAESSGAPLAVVFALTTAFGEGTYRQYDFLLSGLEEVEQELRALNIPFFLLPGRPEDTVPGFAHTHRVGTIVVDYDPLRVRRERRRSISGALVPLFEVDAHNIVPAWYAAPTTVGNPQLFRSRLTKLLPEFLVEFLDPHGQDREWKGGYPAAIDWKMVRDILKIDRSVDPPLEGVAGGREGARRLAWFIEHGSQEYEKRSGDPTAGVRSTLSPYLHFGQLACARVALNIRAHGADAVLRPGSFLDAVIVRRELAENFVTYHPAYDTVDGFPSWARATLAEHRDDPRRYSYTPELFEVAGTHDALWNAAERELVRTGTISGAIREYWASKILEWTPSPEDALHTAIYLNDRYALDGRDPSGYAGIAETIGGLHKDPGMERPITGTIPTISREDLEARYDIQEYIKRNT